MLELPNINFSHVNETSVISEYENWIRISGSFIADSAYTYVVLGNFYDDIYTDTLNLPFSIVSQRAYSCIDDVCVSLDSLYAQTWVGISENEYPKNNISIYPNPAREHLNISSGLPINKIILYDCQGRIAKEIIPLNQNQIQIDIQKLGSGLYFLESESNNVKTIHKIIINQ
jgi:hypothetical protein